MLLKEYLANNDNHRKILVVSDLMKGQGLIRQFEASSGQMVHNVNCMTLDQVVNQIYIYMQAEEGYELNKEIIDRTTALMVFRSILLKNISRLVFFASEKMMDILTTKEIFDKVNLIRADGLSEAGKNSDNPRLVDLRLLVSEYEKYLESNNSLDRELLMKTVFEFLANTSDLKAVIDEIFAAEISYIAEETECFSGLEKGVLKLLQNNMDNPVNVFEDEPAVKALNNIKGKAKFFKGYGSYNEACYVVNDIVRSEHPFGSILVACSSSAQVNTVASIFRGYELPVKVISEYSVEDNPYISLARRIIAWSKEDYSEKQLECILSSPVISVAIKNGDKTEDILNKQSYFDHVLNAEKRMKDKYILGWGYSRNIEFVKHELALAKEEGTKLLLNMHSELISIFSDEDRIKPSTIYNKLVKFVEKYTAKNEDYAAAIDGMRKLSGSIALEYRELSYTEALELIDEMLCTLSKKDTQDNTSILIQQIGDWMVTDRPNVYMTGLSLKDMQGSTNESPVLSDEEMELYLADGYKPTIINQMLLKEKNIYRSLKAFCGDNITFGYSSYDTVGFCDNNPSSIFRELLQEIAGTDTNSLDEFVYGNPRSEVKYNSETDPSLKTEYPVRLETSNSALEMLLDCPKKYGYSKQLHIPENDYVECSFSNWLDAKERGSFFHAIAEKYVLAKLVLPWSEKYEDEVDEVTLDLIVNQIKTDFLAELPVAFPELADKEINRLKKDAKEYLSNLHIELGNSGWRCLMAEQGFDNAAYTVEDYEGKKYNFVLNGIIDRIDYKIDVAEKKVKLRIADYKTGKKASKEKENNLGKLVQYSVYKTALMDTGMYEGKTLFEYVKAQILELNKIEAGEAVENLDNFSYEFDSFYYIFPMDKKDPFPIRIDADELEGLNISRLKTVLTTLDDKKTYVDHIELYEAVKEYMDKYSCQKSELTELHNALTKKDILNPDETNHCQYCSYSELCTNRKAGAF